MAKKLELDMTPQDKLDFVRVLQDGPARLIAFYQKSIRQNNISTAILLPVGIAFGFFLKLNLAIYAPIYIALSALTYGATFFASYRSMNKVLKNASNGKINYWKYKKLVKSGEFDKWLQGDVGKVEETTVEAKPAQQQEGVTLTAEEVAVLKKLMNKKVVESVEEVQQVANPDQTPTPTDAGRNA